MNTELTKFTFVLAMFSYLAILIVSRSFSEKITKLEARVSQLETTK